MSSHVQDAMSGLRKFMFANVYVNPKAKDQEIKAQNVLIKLFEYYKMNKDKMTGEYLDMLRSGEDPERVICDYIAGMTDRYAIAKFEEYFIPIAWKL